VTKQEVLTTIMQCAEKLGHVPSQPELTKMSDVSRRQIRSYFGSYRGALRECSLERSGGGYKVPLDTLFLGWAGIARKLKKLPSLTEYGFLSEHSYTPLLSRFSHWTRVPAGLKHYAEQHGLAEEWSDVLQLVTAREEDRAERARLSGATKGPRKSTRILINQPVYGPMMRPCPLSHGPVNEAGVVYLFGTMAERLGYVVMRMQIEFPDCEAMRRIEDDRWQRVRIEFEYESRNFLKHMHEANECDLIVCWTHNWPECPLEVLELRNELE